jgi:hypothetical protein
MPSIIEFKVAYSGALKCRRKFLRFFPKGFRDPKYAAWERGYKQAACEQWQENLNRDSLRALIRDAQYTELAARAVRIESRTNLLFSFEKMALRDAVRTSEGARLFGEGLYSLLHGPGSLEKRFTSWCEIIGRLPRRQTRVLTWPLVTVFGFIAQPKEHYFLKPQVTRLAAEKYGFPFSYHSRPTWAAYNHLLDFAAVLRRDLADLEPRDMIDLQSFVWVQGSSEYE